MLQSSRIGCSARRRVASPKGRDSDGSLERGSGLCCGSWFRSYHYLSHAVARFPDAVVQNIANRASTARRPHYEYAARVCRLTALLGAAASASAQYHIDSWTTENGLPQNIVRDICQTPDGYLWLATMDGLVRFDGARFVVFNRSNTPGIPGNRFTSLYCTRNGEVWAGTESTGVTRYRQGRFTTYTTRQGLPSDYVSSFNVDDGDHFWALSQGSVVEWDDGRSRFIELPSEKSKYSYYLSSGVRFGFWGINGEDLRLFVRGKVLHYALPRDWPREGQTVACQDLGGTIWLARPDGRLAKLADGRWVDVFRAPGAQTRPSARANVSTTYRDPRGNLWEIEVAADPGLGLATALILPSGGQSQKIAFNSFFEDREGSAWLGTNGQGLYRIRKQAISVLSKEGGLPDQNIYPIYQDRAGAIWIGTWSGGLARVSGGKITIFSLADGLLSRRINSIYEDHDRILWVATAVGLQKMLKGRFEAVQNETLRGRSGPRTIHQDPQGTLWFGTEQGLVRCQNGRWNVFTTKDGLAGNDVRVIIDGRDETLWIGGYGGISCLKHGIFKGWTQSDGLPSNAVRSLYEDPDGVLWIGTYDGGLGRLQNGKFTRYTMREGLFNNGVFQILEDSRGFLWMSCNRGIYRVRKQQLNELAAGKGSTITSVAYGKSDGMRNAECNGGLAPAGIRARDGKLWFPTQDGVVVMDPNAVVSNPAPPPVVIESVLLDREPRPLDRAIRVSPGNENLEIEYTALSFINSERIRFRYQLEGLDRDWVDAGTRRTAYYSHPPPGNYRFRVIAANSDGVWNLQGQSIPIAVLPSVYRTWWFLTLASLVGAGVVVLAWQYRVSHLQRANALQQAFSRQLIDSQESERQRIAGELHDSLGQTLLIIKNRATLALRSLGDRESAQEQLDEISASASDAIEEVRTIAYNLRPYQLDRFGLTKTIEAMYKQAARSSGISFTTELEPLDGVFSKQDEISIYRIVQEAVNNIVKHSQASEAQVVIERQQEAVELRIRDNGRGFASVAAQAYPGRGGFGLIGMAERVRMMGGSFAVDSSAGEGTTIVIKLSVPQNGYQNDNSHRDR